MDTTREVAATKNNSTMEEMISNTEDMSSVMFSGWEEDFTGKMESRFQVPFEDFKSDAESKSNIVSSNREAEVVYKNENFDDFVWNEIDLAREKIKDLERMLSSQRELHEMANQKSREQREALEQRLEDITSKYKETKKRFKTLERKFDDQTQELSVSKTNLKKIEDLLHKQREISQTVGNDESRKSDHQIHCLLSEREAARKKIVELANLLQNQTEVYQTVSNRIKKENKEMERELLAAKSDREVALYRVEELEQMLNDQAEAQQKMCNIIKEEKESLGSRFSALGLIAEDVKPGRPYSDRMQHEQNQRKKTMLNGGRKIENQAYRDNFDATYPSGKEYLSEDETSSIDTYSSRFTVKYTKSSRGTKDRPTNEEIYDSDLEQSYVGNDWYYMKPGRNSEYKMMGKDDSASVDTRDDDSSVNTTRSSTRKKRSGRSYLVMKRMLMNEAKSNTSLPEISHNGRQILEQDKRNEQRETSAKYNRNNKFLEQEKNTTLPSDTKQKKKSTTNNESRKLYMQRLYLKGVMDGQKDSVGGIKEANNVDNRNERETKRNSEQKGMVVFGKETQIVKDPPTRKIAGVQFSDRRLNTVSRMSNRRKQLVTPE